MHTNTHLILVLQVDKISVSQPLGRREKISFLKVRLSNFDSHENPNIFIKAVKGAIISWVYGDNQNALPIYTMQLVYVLW